ncbi:MAG: AAA family ATPase [Actinobacteria bacterium]|nr:AAA family ATPase [Actinomycetota bacterium]
MIRVAVYDKDPRIAALLLEVLRRDRESEPLGAASSIDDVRRALSVHPGSVGVFGPSVGSDELAVASELSRTSPGSSFVQVVDELDAETIRASMRHGIRDVVAIPDVEREFAPAVHRAHEMATAVAASSARPERNAHGRVVTVFSTKGGTGRSTVATNLAALQAKAGTSTLLLDASRRFGDCASLLRLRPDHTLSDLVGVTSLDDTIMQAVATPHESGLTLFAAPNDPLEGSALSADLLSSVIKRLRELYQLIVIDTNSSLDDFTNAALGSADLALMVTSLDLPAIKDAKLCLSMLDRVGVASERVRVVLNRANSDVGFPSAEVAKAIGHPVAHGLPSDVAVPRAINDGVPVVWHSPKSKIAKALSKLGEDTRHDLALAPLKVEKRALFLRPARAKATI